MFLPLRGEYSRSAMAAAQRRGMVPVLWSMDVRDSEAIHEEYAQEIAERSQSGELILIPPVSYTHRDVYKRQFVRYSVGLSAV